MVAISIHLANPTAMSPRDRIEELITLIEETEKFPFYRIGTITLEITPFGPLKSSAPYLAQLLYAKDASAFQIVTSTLVAYTAKRSTCPSPQYIVSMIDVDEPERPTLIDMAYIHDGAMISQDVAYPIPAMRRPLDTICEYLSSTPCDLWGRTPIQS